VLFAAAGLWLYFGIDGYVINYMPDPNSAFTPDQKLVSIEAGAWLANYQLYQWMMLAPAAGFAGALLVYIAANSDRSGIAFMGSTVSIAGIILTAGFSLFPFVMPSSTDLNSSLTLWDSASSELTLTIMFWVSMFFIPLIAAYSFWTYRKMWRRLDSHFIRNNEHTTY
jgi:cytochrome d ubiquinol oxidase subunit II